MSKIMKKDGSSLKRKSETGKKEAETLIKGLPNPIDKVQMAK
jgi:hypothetical protein